MTGVSAFRLTLKTAHGAPAAIRSKKSRALRYRLQSALNSSKVSRQSSASVSPKS